MFPVKMSLSCCGDVSQGGVSGNGPSQNSVLMLSSESFRSTVLKCEGSGSLSGGDKRRSGSAKIGMVQVEAAFAGLRGGFATVDGVGYQNAVWSQLPDTS